jgi:DNA (cytosine-5)-methyltransferase 1
MSEKTINFISTFAGIGGFDLGFNRAGMTCLEQVERDPSCLRLLETRFPGSKRHNDIKDYSYHGRKAVNVICGGFPCQDLSIAGRRAGLDGKRSGLYFQFARLIEESLPRFFVLENVPGLLSSHEGRDLEIILRGMVKRGYCVAWRIFDSQYFRIPQRRRRVFIVGSLGDGSAAEVLFESSSLSGDPPSSQEAREGDPSGPRGSSSSGRGRIAPTLRGSGVGTARTGAEILESKSETLTLNYEAPIVLSISNNGGNGRNIKESNVSDTIDRRPGALAYKIRDGKEGGGKGYLESDKAFSLTNKDTQKIGLRRFTPLECERLQGFPDGWTEGFSDTVRYRMLGNAVSVPVAEWIAKRIVKIIKES